MKDEEATFVQLVTKHLRLGGRLRELLSYIHGPLFMGAGRGGDSEAITKGPEDRELLPGSSMGPL